MASYLFHLFQNLLNPFPENDSEFLLKRKGVGYFIKKIRLILFSIVVTGFFKAFVDVGVIYIPGLLIDSLNPGVISFHNFQFSQKKLLIFAAFLLLICRPLTALTLSLLCDHAMRARFSPMIRWMFYKKVINNDLAFFNRNHAGKIASAVWQAGQAITEFLLSALQMVWSSIAYILLSLGLMATINLWFLIVIGLWLILYIYLSLKYAPEIRRRSRKSADASNSINGHLVDIFSNIINVKSLSPQGDDSGYFKEKMTEFMGKNECFLRAITCAETLLLLTSSTAMVVTGLICVYSWNRGVISVGEVTIIFGLAFRLEGQLSLVMNHLTSAMRSLGLFNSSVEAIHHHNLITAGSAARTISPMSGHIRFCDIRFQYEEEKPVICGLNLNIRAGEKIAIVGESGSGKSTLINLLMRFYDPYEGFITIDETDIRQLALNQLRQQFSIVTQDNLLFNRSIYENITFGCSDFTEEDVRIAAQKAKALDFILQATDGTHTGFETVIGDRGVRLSGGQRQRLSICRAILRNAPVLILDEATSALDSLTESEISDALNDAMAGKTVIAIAHRLSSISSMDRIIVLNKGQIEEEGSHDELVANQGGYYSLWKQQTHL